METAIAVAFMVLGAAVLLVPMTRAGNAFFAEHLGSWTPEQWHSHPRATLVARLVVGLLWIGVGLWVSSG